MYFALTHLMREIVSALKEWSTKVIMITSDECVLVSVIYHFILFEQNPENCFPLMLYFLPVFYCHSTFLLCSAAVVNSCTLLVHEEKYFFEQKELFLWGRASYVWYLKKTQTDKSILKKTTKNNY